MKLKIVEFIKAKNDLPSNPKNAENWYIVGWKKENGEIEKKQFNFSRHYASLLKKAFNNELATIDWEKGKYISFGLE